ncbi:MAG: ABC transporter permease [Bacillota bacterium]|nr:ABC transporter permease [Bacillota bacterium]
MAKYIIKRILTLIPIMLGIIFVVFTIMELAPGDPGRIILGQFATEAEVQALNAELGYNRPFLVRYLSYVFHFFQGDLGKSYLTNIPVIESITTRFPVTLLLVTFSIILTIIISIPLGTIAAVKQYSFIDGFSIFLAIFLSSVPIFWLGLLFILFFALALGWFPVTGIESMKSYVLPTITTAAATTAVITRMTRTTMLTVLREDYIRTAKAKGANRNRIIKKHAIKNALIPVITVIGINFGSLLGGTVLVETVFGMPGMGTLLVNAIRMKDVPVVLGCVTLLALSFSMVNLLVDISYGFMDPRVKG